MMGARPAETTRGSWTRRMDTSARSVCYEIRVRGLLGETLLGAFPGLRARADGTETMLTGALPDQAALHGVLSLRHSLTPQSADCQSPRPDDDASPSLA